MKTSLSTGLIAALLISTPLSLAYAANHGAAGANGAAHAHDHDADSGNGADEQDYLANQMKKFNGFLHASPTGIAHASSNSILGKVRDAFAAQDQNSLSTSCTSSSCNVLASAFPGISDSVSYALYQAYENYKSATPKP